MKHCAAASLAIVAFAALFAGIEAQESIWPPANVTSWPPPAESTPQAINTPSPWFQDNCRQQHSTQTNSNHQTFYNIDEISYNINNSVEFKVLVQATQEARILLIPQNWATPMTPLYEIILGDDRNRRFTLNRNGTRVVRVSRDGLLNSNSYLPVIVRIFNDGLVQLQIDGEQEPFLSAANRNHEPIRFVGFTINGNVASHWLFDCPIDRPAPRVCQQYMTPVNVNQYLSFWRVRDLDDNTQRGDIRLNLQVRTVRNVRILLSSVANFNAGVSAPYYEIVLGAGDNREFELQRNTGRLDRTTANNLLTPTAWTPIEISILSGGNIDIRVAGSNGARLRNRDSNLINVRYISFRTVELNMVSEWRFDC